MKAVLVQPRFSLRPMFLRKGMLLGASVAMWLTPRVQACAVCMGGDNEQLADASNSVLWALLALVGFIFVATGLTAWFLMRKAAQAAALPPHLALIESLALEPEPSKD